MWGGSDYIKAVLDGAVVYFAGDVYTFEQFMQYFGKFEDIKIYKLVQDGTYDLIYDSKKKEEEGTTKSTKKEK
ncbi:MAG: hypothetical protein NZZ41_06715 [Candidatus Dojkabacteria bacterium]|nr:hypothetical protein [Candidatus Dojkabacteria bacterium]